MAAGWWCQGALQALPVGALMARPEGCPLPRGPTPAQVFPGKCLAQGPGGLGRAHPLPSLASLASRAGTTGHQGCPRHAVCAPSQGLHKAVLWASAQGRARDGTGWAVARLGVSRHLPRHLTPSAAAANQAEFWGDHGDGENRDVNKRGTLVQGARTGLFLGPAQHLGPACT